MARILSLVTQHVPPPPLPELKFSPWKLDPSNRVSGEGRVIHLSNPGLESYTVPDKAFHNNSDVTF